MINTNFDFYEIMQFSLNSGCVVIRELPLGSLFKRYPQLLSIPYHSTPHPSQLKQEKKGRNEISVIWTRSEKLNYYIQLLQALFSQRPHSSC